MLPIARQGQSNIKAKIEVFLYYKLSKEILNKTHNNYVNVNALVRNFGVRSF